MSVTVKQITDLCMKNKDIETIIKEQLQIIDNKLLHSEKIWGSNCIIHSLPTTVIGITGLDRKDVQRIIYSSIICSLNNRGFTTKIVLDDVYSVLYICWTTELDRISINTMNSIIKNNRISKEELNNIIRK